MNAATGEHLLELPFDQYQRYKVAADLVDLLETPPRRPVVDVGGAPGFAESFLPEREVTVVDVEGKYPGRFVIASGTRLPFPDRTFAVGLALDTLEHVPAPDRRAFLAELQRVSDVVILSAPFADGSVELAEAALHEFVIGRFGGPFPTLEEHAVHGLPVLADTVSTVAGKGWATATLPSGYLPRWLAGMLLHHEFLAMGMPELPKLHAFYNASISPSDAREPSYRHVLVAARELPAEQVTSAVESLRSDGDDAQGDAAIRAIAGATLALRVGGYMRAGEIETLRTQLAERDGQIARLTQANSDLKEELQAAQRDLVLEARRSLSAVALQRASDWRARRKQ